MSVDLIPKIAYFNIHTYMFIISSSRIDSFSVPENCRNYKVGMNKSIHSSVEL